MRSCSWAPLRSNPAPAASGRLGDQRLNCATIQVIASESKPYCRLSGEPFAAQTAEAQIIQTGRSP